MEFLTVNRNRWKGIEKTSGVCGDRACIAGTRIPVWGLVQAKKLGYTEENLLKSYPSLTPENLADAWAYAEAFPDEIARDIRENEDAE
ncbi:DUF433 domain-containing protein [Baaleninema sp.]|uniref:DUF433 domain-containing protein n=1 Tax=Baaleninema sp. TaxID=3101197 RepID=UPI003D01821A